MLLRPYQQEAYDSTLAMFDVTDSAICVMATGLGKTVYAAHVVDHFAKTGKVMILAHREELIFQAKDTMHKVTGHDADIEMGVEWANPSLYASKIVVSTIQTQCAGREGGRMTRFDPDDFSLLLVDECFPKGTLIDGIPIEERKIGDRIRTFHHCQKSMSVNTITHVFKRKTNTIAELTLSDGRKIVCTPNHPIFSLRGYIPAGKLLSSDMVLTTIPYKETDYGIQFQVQDLRDNVHCERQKKEIVRRRGVQAENEFTDDGKDEPEIRQRPHDEKESHAQTRNQGESFDQAKSKGVGAACSWWQWKRPDRTAKTTSMCLGLADGSCDTNKNGKRQWLSNLLQIGYRKLRSKIRNRSGWTKPQVFIPPSSRLEEGGLFKYVRVESVTIYEQESSDRFEQLCPGGIVYNLEVENDNNYFVENTLVHNCHHAPAKTYRRVIDHYKQNKNLKVLGLTATPDRKDGKAMGQIFNEVAYAYDIRDGIDDGWLVPVEQMSVYVSSLDYSAVKSQGDDLNGKDLAAVLEFEENLHAIADPTVKLTGDKKTLVFTASVVQAERLTEIINRHKPDSARYICGKTPKDIRRIMLSDYAENKFQYLVNVAVATEGFDDPGIQCVVLARPTKSRSLYTQMVGRGTRPLGGIVDLYDDAVERRDAIAKSGKPSIEIIDFVGNSGKHKLITTADILGGKYDDDVVELAKEFIEGKGKPADVASELVKAEREIAKREAARADAMWRDKVMLRATFSTAKVNPFDVLDVNPIKETSWHKGKPPTKKQLEYLKHKGVDTDGMGYTHAKQVIETLWTRQQTGKATYKQTKVLRKFKYDTSEMTFAEAGKLIGALAANRWRRPRGS